jgi:transposase InsO family protein
MMTNRKITIEQVGLYMKNRKAGDIQTVAAAKAGISVRSAKRIDKGRFSKDKLVHVDNVRDPLHKVWKSELVPILEKDPHLRAITLLEELQDRYPEEYPDSLLRTIQRRVQNWKSLHGPTKERMFLQEHPPGWQSISDFTNCDDLNVTILGQSLPHLLYHFRMPFSSWAYAFVILGGESYPALSTGFQNALWELGGVPKTHRTDSLSAAYKNLSKIAQEDFTKAYDELCAHYDVEPTRNNKGVKHENGSIESPHRHLKEKIDQKLRLRGSRDFCLIEEYRRFVDDVVKKKNSRIHTKLREERKHLKALPKHRTRDYDTESVLIPSTGIITIRQAYYAVPSRLIGSTLTVHIHDDRLECFLATTYVITFKRLRWGKSGPRPRNIDYRLVIPELVRKPQAFRNYVFRDDLFPNDAFRRTWSLLDSQLDKRVACKEIVQILKLAADGYEERITQELQKLLREQYVPRLSDLQAHLKICRTITPVVRVDECDLASYDDLLKQATI